MYILPSQRARKHFSYLNGVHMQFLLPDRLSLTHFWIRYIYTCDDIATLEIVFLTPLPVPAGKWRLRPYEGYGDGEIDEQVRIPAPPALVIHLLEFVEHDPERLAVLHGRALHTVIL